jgi:hypothetical protein
MKSARCRLSSAFIEQRNLAAVEAESADWKEPGGKLWSIRILGAKCPFENGGLGVLAVARFLLQRS